MTAFNSHIGTQNPDDASDEMMRLSGLVAHLVLLIEDMERVGNKSAELSLRVQYHQAMADLLQSMMHFAGTFDARSEGLRQRHVERAVEYQHELDRLGNRPE